LLKQLQETNTESEKKKKMVKTRERERKPDDNEIARERPGLLAKSNH